jgi:hypothetical protein
MEYRHKQFGFVINTALLMCILVFVFSNYGKFQPISIAVPVILIAALALFYSLSIEIHDNVLICRMGLGLIQKRILLSEIQQARTVQNPWYAGWGIHWLPGQFWIWNVSGLRGVELTLKNGKRFRIGTDEPESLVHAIESNKTIATRQQ